MRAVDTNILVYAHRKDVPQNPIAVEVLKSLIDSSSAWFIAWPSVYEFLRLVTHPKIFVDPTPRKTALKVIESLVRDGGAHLIGHGAAHLEKLLELSEEVHASGNLWFDVQIAGVLEEHGIKEIVTNDGDFLRFKRFTVINPFG